MAWMKRSLTILWFLALTVDALPSAAARLGTVVPIGGQASDIALDNLRGRLYIANFTANRINVVSTTDFSARPSINVAPQPASLAISPDSQYLLVAHYTNNQSNSPSNILTLINLNTGIRQTFSTIDPPLGVAFMQDGRALIATTTTLLLMDPQSGVMQFVTSFAILGGTLPSSLATFPAQVISAQLSPTNDGAFIYGIANSPSGQAYFRFDARLGQVSDVNIVASPKPLARLSVAADGSWAMVGEYKVNPGGYALAQFPNAITSVNIGGVAVDSQSNTIYAQILTTQNAAPSPIPGSSTGAAATPVLSILDADNLTVREKIMMPENIIGRAILSPAADVLYAVSDSGALVLPVGSLNQSHRLAASQEDVVASANFCDRQVLVRTLTITDPGGGNTDFTISSGAAGVRISPASGMTPATVEIQIDGAVYQNLTGTMAVPLTLSSSSAVNLPNPVRLLINNRTPDQRGTMVNIPGTLTDLLADPIRSRFYVIRQDMNQVQVFDASSFTRIATLRTSTTPTQMTLTLDRKYLVVGHDNSQLAYVYDLDSLQTQPPIFFPPGQYPHSIAASSGVMLAVVRNAASGPSGLIDQIDFNARTASILPTLGTFKNGVDPNTVLAPSPRGDFVLAAAPDGNVLLYNAAANTFTASRKDFPGLSGAYAASDYNTYVVGPNLLNSSLVPVATLETASGTSSGFAFVDQAGFRTTVQALSSPGIIQRVDPVQGGISPTRMVEAPLLSSSNQPFIRSLAPLNDQSAVISLSVSGITVLPWDYDAAIAPPQIRQVLNAADLTQPIAPGGLITVFGSQLSPVSTASDGTPLPTTLGNSCVMINGTPLPLFQVSSDQITGQLPFSATPNSTMTVLTTGGASAKFPLSIFATAPSVFRSGTAGPQTGIPTIVRAANNQFVTPTNPIHPSDTIIIYATGLGLTTPAVDSGMPAPSDPLTVVTVMPQVTLGGTGLFVSYAGLVPGYVGLYQINASVPFKIPEGMNIPLVINQAGHSTQLSVRVVQ